MVCHVYNWFYELTVIAPGHRRSQRIEFTEQFMHLLVDGYGLLVFEDCEVRRLLDVVVIDVSCLSSQHRVFSIILYIQLKIYFC